MIPTPQEVQEVLVREALFSLQKTWVHAHDAQHQGVQALQQGKKPQEGRRGAQTQQASQWNELCPIDPQGH